MKKANIIGFVAVVVVILVVVGIWYFSRGPVSRELEQFTIAIDKDIDGIYPKTEAEVVSTSVNSEIFSGLTNFSREGRLIPDLADYWTNPDDLTWEIFLKKGVKFHDGTELTAKDVEFSLVTVPDAIEEFYAKESVAQIAKVEVVDNYTLKITTKKPYPLLMNDLSGLEIVSKDYIEKNGYDADPIGSGPYKFVKWEKGKEITLERFEDYFGGKPIAKKVVYKIIPEEKNRIEALTKGEVDFITQLTLDGVDEIEKTSGLKSAVTPSIGITFLGMDNAKKTAGIKLAKNPLSDARVRKAIAYSIDKEAIVNEVFKGRAKIATQISIPEAFGYNSTLQAYPYDTEKAKELLTKAGYPNGFKVEFLSPDDERAKVSKMIGEQLSTVGIKAEVKVLPRGDFFDKLFAGKASLFPLTILDEALDAAGLASAMFHTPTEDYGSLNLVNYSNPTVDDLIEKSMGTLDQQARNGYAQEIMRITIEEDPPYIPLYIGEFLGGVRKDLEFSQRPDGSLNLADLSFVQ